MEDMGVLSGILTVKNRESLTLDGVSNVDSFDEGCVTLSTASGRVIIEGTDLKIVSLIRESGEILITGKISGVFYSDEKPVRGILSRLFK